MLLMPKLRGMEALWNKKGEMGKETVASAGMEGKHTK